MNGIIAGVTQIFDNVATNITKVWGTVNRQGSPATLPAPTAPSPPAQTEFEKFLPWVIVGVIAIFVFIGSRSRARLVS